MKTLVPTHTGGLIGLLQVFAAVLEGRTSARPVWMVGAVDVAGGLDRGALERMVQARCAVGARWTKEGVLIGGH